MSATEQKNTNKMKVTGPTIAGGNHFISSLLLNGMICFFPPWQGTRAPSQYKDHLSRYRDSHYEDKTVMRPSYLYKVNSYSGKIVSLY